MFWQLCHRDDSECRLFNFWTVNIFALQSLKFSTPIFLIAHSPVYESELRVRKFSAIGWACSRLCEVLVRVLRNCSAVRHVPSNVDAVWNNTRCFKSNFPFWKFHCKTFSTACLIGSHANKALQNKLKTYKIKWLTHLIKVWLLSYSKLLFGGHRRRSRKKRMVVHVASSQLHAGRTISKIFLRKA